MGLTHRQMEQVRALLCEEEIIALESSEEQYVCSTTCWIANLDQRPAIVLRPQTLERLQATVGLLYKSSLDFAVRATGVGSASARDVVLDVSAFDGFEFDSAEETVLLGAGQKWGEVYGKMEREAPGYAGMYA